jgi:hypothetical protein
VLQLGKGEREKQNGIKAKVKNLRPFCFASQDAIECMIRFMIDNRTIKRENL